MFLIKLENLPEETPFNNCHIFKHFSIGTIWLPYNLTNEMTNGYHHGIALQGAAQVNVEVFDHDGNDDDHVDSLSITFRGPPGNYESLVTLEARTK